LDGRRRDGSRLELMAGETASRWFGGVVQRSSLPGRTNVGRCNDVRPGWSGGIGQGVPRLPGMGWLSLTPARVNNLLLRPRNYVRNYVPKLPGTGCLSRVPLSMLCPASDIRTLSATRKGSLAAIWRRRLHAKERIPSELQAVHQISVDRDGAGRLVPLLDREKHEGIHHVDKVHLDGTGGRASCRVINPDWTCQPYFRGSRQKQRRPSAAQRRRDFRVHEPAVQRGKHQHHSCHEYCGCSPRTAGALRYPSDTRPKRTDACASRTERVDEHRLGRTAVSHQPELTNDHVAQE
jgi:hypothetical protein